MDSLIVFVPKSLKADDEGYLYGVFEDNLKMSPAFYILGLEDTISLSTIGFYNKQTKRQNKNTNCVHLNVVGDELVLLTAVFRGEEIDLNKCHVVEYDESALVESELLDNVSPTSCDHFDLLTFHVKKHSPKKRYLPVDWFTSRPFTLTLNFFTSLFSIMSRATLLTRFTTIGQHLHDSSKYIVWLLQTLKTEGRISLETGNYILALVVDVLGGFAATYALFSWHNDEETFDLIANETEDDSRNVLSWSPLCSGLRSFGTISDQTLRPLNNSGIICGNTFIEVTGHFFGCLEDDQHRLSHQHPFFRDKHIEKGLYWELRAFFNNLPIIEKRLLELIKDTIKWLMGSPAGLKLNYPLNYILGNFFLYNIYLWWIFLGLIRPILETGFYFFLQLGFVGITSQLSILADIFSLVSFHMYCIYIYAAKLYHLQLQGIISLFRIFLGRNRNPEPGKVDSCPYTTEQLFIGTVGFTVLLFLLPTTLVYYVVFTQTRLLFIIVGGLLTRVKYAFQILPLYSTAVWLVYPKLVTSTMKLVPVPESASGGSITLKAEPVVSSWFETVSKCIPRTLNVPKTVNHRQLFHNMLSGKIIYPI